MIDVRQLGPSDLGAVVALRRQALDSQPLAFGAAPEDVGQLHLSVTEVAAEARRLYVSAGFVECGREPRSLNWAGHYADEIHLALLLK